MDATVKIPPGVVRGASASDTPGTWYDANLVRWVGGILRPVPGWDRVASDPSLSKMRATHQWQDNEGIQYIGVLCEEHVYVYRDGNLQNITPVDGLVGPSENPLVGGYGSYEYSLDTYGTPRPDVPSIGLTGPAWSIDNWGEDLLVMSSYDGRLLRWSPSTPTTPCVVVPDAPLNNRLFVVTPQRHVVLFGAGADARRLAWCSQEDIEDWDTADPLNTAGEYFIEPASPLLSAKSIKSGVAFFTAKKAYFLEYIGVPYVYSYREIGEGIAPMSAQSLAASGDKIIWWSNNGFWAYDAGSLTPIPCTVLDWLKNESDPDYRRIRSFGMAIGEVTETWWFFPTVGEVENNRYVSFNFVSGEWSIGWLSRTCGCPGTFLTYPIMSDGTKLYYHEKGDRYGDNMLPYAETASINLKSGGKFSTILQVVPDHGHRDDVVYTFYGRNGRVDPHSPGEFSKGPLGTRVDGYLDVRQTARDHRMRISSASDGVKPWTFGEALFKVAQRGGR